MEGKELAVVDLTPREVVEGATTQAKLLMNIVEQTKCYQEISGKKYLQVEAWETIGAFNRTHAETECVKPIVKEGEIIGYEAHVQLFKDGDLVGGAIMPCYFTENCCKGKEAEAKHKAAMSAAQTFATSKAYRMNYSYVAILAGFQPTPAEEMGIAEQKAEHWCPIHDTAFFKRGRMKWYAHKIEGTNDWCSEDQVKKQKAQTKAIEAGKAEAKATPSSTGKEPEEPIACGIDLNWLSESLKTIHWTRETATTWIKSQFADVDTTGGLMEDILPRLTTEQKADFVRKIEELLEVA